MNHRNTLDGVSKSIFDGVVEAMQPAEELGGPEGTEYLKLMLAIATEANERATTFASHAVFTERRAPYNAAKPDADRDAALELSKTDAAFIISPNGLRTDYAVEDLANGITSLAELQRAVGGYIQMIVLPGGAQMFVNEEGKLYDLPRNEEATKLAKAVLFEDDFISGAAVVLSGKWRMTE